METKKITKKQIKKYFAILKQAEKVSKNISKLFDESDEMNFCLNHFDIVYSANHLVSCMKTNNFEKYL
jgi:hypothetical protein